VLPCKEATLSLKTPSGSLPLMCTIYLYNNVLEWEWLIFAVQVYSFWNVCIEAVQNPVAHIKLYHGRKVLFNETAKIIVYNSLSREGLQNLPVAGDVTRMFNNWDIHFRQGRIPSSHTFHNSTVFFVAQSCPANLHHFWVDEFVPLYYIVSRVNRLYPGADNQILYRRAILLSRCRQ